jgi:hypothetical protein
MTLQPPDVQASLTLARAPLRTLYFFGCSVGSGTASAARFVATHPLTLGLALPLLLFYGGAKAVGTHPDTTAAIDVSRSRECLGGVPVAVSSAMPHRFSSAMPHRCCVC